MTVIDGPRIDLLFVLMSGKLVDIQFEDEYSL